MTDLADYFSKPAIDDSDERWLKAATNNPAAWRDPENPITERVILTLCQDQSINPANVGPARKTLRAMAADLLISASGDERRLRDALDRCRMRGRESWLNLNPWQQKAAIMVELSKKPRPDTEEEWLHVPDTKPKDYLKGLPVCPLCHAVPCECDD